jgi:hypothetical protein
MSFETLNSAISSYNVHDSMYWTLLHFQFCGSVDWSSFDGGTSTSSGVVSEDLAAAIKSDMEESCSSLLGLLSELNQEDPQPHLHLRTLIEEHAESQGQLSYLKDKLSVGCLSIMTDLHIAHGVDLSDLHSLDDETLSQVTPDHFSTKLRYAWTFWYTYLSRTNPCEEWKTQAVAIDWLAWMEFAYLTSAHLSIGSAIEVLNLTGDETCKQVPQFHSRFRS